MASREPGLTVSATATSPINRAAASLLAGRTATSIAVFPSVCSRVMSRCSESIAIPSFCIIRGLPMMRL